MKVRTRMAPSPTGQYHIGHIRTVLYDYALAKKHGGQFIIRNEDTDRERFVEGAMDAILDVIKDYGLSWDEGPRVGGKYGPYVQSERLPIYKEHALELVNKGLAYYCFLTPEEGKELQEIARAKGEKFRSSYRDATKEEVDAKLKEGKPYVIRLKVPLGESVSYVDAVYGEITYKTDEVDDQVLLKSDGFPTYHLAVVVDDHLMDITHIMRGNDWLPSTPKHVLLYKAFGWEMPVTAHLPNLKELGGSKKLSKRFGAVFAIQFLEEGYLTDALLNFLMLLGWNPGGDREIFTLEEFIQEFDISRIHKTDLVAFDRQKLLWMNKTYIAGKSNSELKEIFIKWADRFLNNEELKSAIKSDKNFEAKLELLKERARTLVELAEMVKFYYTKPTSIEWNIKQLKNIQNNLPELLEKLNELMASMGEDTSTWKHEEWEHKVRELADKFQVKHGEMFMLLRIAITGSPVSPPLFESMQILGKKEVLERIKI